MTADVLRVVVPKDRLRSILKDKRTLYLMLGCAGNQITTTDVPNPQSFAVPFFVVDRDDTSLNPVTSQPGSGVTENRGPLWFWLDGC